MAAKRDITVAYNGYVIGGESAVALPLDAIRLRESYGRYEVEVDFVLRGVTAAAFATERASCEAALRAKSKNLGVTMGERITGTDGVANGTTTFTAATGTFATSDVGLPLNIEGRGAFQIVTVNSSTSVVLSATVSTGTALTWRIGSTWVQCTPSLNTQGGFIRNELTEPGDLAYDTPVTARFVFRAGFERLADNSGDSYRREAQVAIAYTASRQRLVTFTGTYTAGGGNTALANYLANVAAWVSTRLTEISGTATFEKVGEPDVRYDDERNVLTFAQAHREVLFDQASTGTNEASIVADAITFRRVGAWRHGRSAGDLAPVRALISYACAVDQTVTGPASLKTFYVATVKPYMVTKATSILGGTPAIETEDVGFDVSTNTISATLGVVLVGVGAGIVEYDEVVTYNLDRQRTFRKRWDGKPDTYNAYTPGHRVTCTRVVSQVTVGASGDAGGATGSISAAFGALLPGSGGSISNIVGAAVGGGAGSSGSGTDLFHKPPASFEAAGDGDWVPLSEAQVLGRWFVGRDVDSQGTPAAYYRTVTTQGFLWVSSASTEAPARTESGLGPNIGRRPEFTPDPASFSGA